MNSYLEVLESSLKGVEKLFLVQLQGLLMDYAYLPDQSEDPRVRAAFRRASDWIEGKTKANFLGERLSFEEAMADYLGLPVESREFQERFAEFRRNFLRLANNPALEKSRADL